MSDGRLIQRKTLIDLNDPDDPSDPNDPRIGPVDQLPQHPEAADLRLIASTMTSQLETITQTLRSTWLRLRHRKVILCLTDGL